MTRALSTVIFCVALFLTFFPGHLLADSPIILFPKSISPGDAFLIDVKSTDQPIGIFNGKEVHFYPAALNHYHAVLSAGLSMKPGIYGVEVTLGNVTVKKDLIVIDTTFPIRRLSLPEEKVFLSPENQERANLEQANLSEIWKQTTNPLWEGRFQPPLNSDISTPFGVKRIINDKKESIHRGADYRGALGDPVLAVNRGTVTLTDELFYGGKTVIVNHGGGIYSVYMHLSRFNVSKGQSVEKGTAIGFVGSTGRTTGPHLHLSVKIRGESINPLSLYVLPLSGVMWGSKQEQGFFTE
jgi:murein DD-endopeptidase MepM/ murein hydrolase activator NlpD